MVPALESTLEDLGIDLNAQENVTLDLDERPNKSPRAFCAPIEVPDRVMLVIQPIGGPDDWRALFHEARAHRALRAHVTQTWPWRRSGSGDNAVTEGWAMLLQHLTDEPEWLTRRLDFPRPNEYAVEGRDRPPLLRAPLRGQDPLRARVPREQRTSTTMRGRYDELLGDALKIDVTPANYLADIDSGFYVSSYLRSWAFEAQLRAYLNEKFGSSGSRAARPGRSCASSGRGPEATATRC